ncbi:MAG: rRNA maturation RNase YbeY [Verrucomicrobia bacterium]|nr:rRNA maturation RNase YbeY [Verrucomicrobiota bacterium]
MTPRLTLRNRQHTRTVRLRRLRQLVRALHTRYPPRRPVHLGIHLVDATEMTRLNERFLRHAGPTDVIAFDYANAAGAPPRETPAADIVICVDEAVRQARRFRTRWTTEVARYLIHGLLHLDGFDDRQPAARRRMKREENRRLRHLARHFALSTVAGSPKLPP